MESSSPARAATTTTESAAAPETSEPAPAEAATAPAATAPAAPSMAPDREGQEDRQTPAATAPAATTSSTDRADEDEGHERQQEQGLRRNAARSANANRRFPSQIPRALRADETVLRDVELARELARHRGSEGERRLAVILPLKDRNDSPAELAGITVGDEALCAATDFDPTTPASIGARLLRHDQDDDAGIAHTVAGLRLRSDAPLTSDLERDVADVALPDVRHGDDRELTTGPLLHTERDTIDRGLRIGGQHVRRIDHDLGGRR